MHGYAMGMKLNKKHQKSLQTIVESYNYWDENHRQRQRDLKLGNYGAIVLASLAVLMLINPSEFEIFFGEFGSLIISGLAIFCLPFSRVFQRPEKWECSVEKQRLAQELKSMGFDGYVVGNKIFYTGSDTGWNVFSNDSYEDFNQNRKFFISKINAYNTREYGPYNSYEMAQEMLNVLESQTRDTDTIFEIIEK